MSNLGNTEIIIIAVIVMVVCGIVAFYIIRMMKGKLEIELSKTGYNSGEPVSGKVKLTTRKSLELRRLYVALIGYQIIEHHDNEGNRKTRRNEIYRDEFNLEEAQSITGGQKKIYDFSLVAPGSNSPTGGNKSNDSAGKAVAEMVGAAVQTLGALGVLGTNSRRLEWKLEARADLPGIDLAKSKTVRVNMM